MKRAVAVLLSLMLTLLFIAPAVPAQEESRTVSAEGVAAIQNGQRDIARDAAIFDAQQRAVEQAIGTLIDSQTMVENFQVISDSILSQTKGYIKRYNITGEYPEGNLLRITITAEVSLGKISDDLSAIGILLGQVHKPRTMILIAEQNIGQEVVAWWLGAVHGQSTDMAVTETTLMDKFTEKGFEMIDHEAAAQNIKVTSAYKVQNLSTEQARTLGNQAAAEVVLVGKSLARLQGNVGALKSAQADLTVKAIRTDSGQVLASVSTHGAAVHVSEVTAGIDALKKASAEASDQLITKILAQYSKEVGGSRSINITISGFTTKAQFVKFKDVLKNQVRGIKNLHERSYANGTAKISVDSKNSAQILSDELATKDFGTFSVDVTSSSANQLELRVIPPGGAAAPIAAPQQALSAPAPAPAAAAPAMAAPAAAGFLDGGEFMLFDNATSKSGRVGKLLTPATPTHPEAEFLMFSGSSKRWCKNYCGIRPAAPSELQVGARVVFFEGNSREGIYQAPQDKSEARMDAWWRDLITDNSLAQTRGIVTVGGYKVSTDNVFIEMK